MGDSVDDGVSLAWLTMRLVLWEGLEERPGLGVVVSRLSVSKYFTSLSVLSVPSWWEEPVSVSSSSMDTLRGGATGLEILLLGMPSILPRPLGALVAVDCCLVGLIPTLSMLATPTLPPTTPMPN